METFSSLLTYCTKIFWWEYCVNLRSAFLYSLIFILFKFLNIFLTMATVGWKNMLNENNFLLIPNDHIIKYRSSIMMMHSLPSRLPLASISDLILGQFQILFKILLNVIDNLFSWRPDILSCTTSLGIEMYG